MSEIDDLAEALKRIPDEAVQLAALDLIDTASREGGSFMGYRLTAQIAKSKSAGVTSSTVVEGSSRGFWAIKTYGRDAVEDMSGVRAMPMMGGYRASAGPAGPAKNGDWTVVYNRALDRFPELVVEAVEDI